ncbi:type II toxin-antitoxin system HipA family toxin (plasmid) [Agrobacterium sp. rho-13.3]|uniref:type II toxin-antitoxin system HipA family toxin n=1 Tax=Agrobacterium sp. rho-13.3 TaxID=3072980 RepID=UPI002A115485|nr:type II toxin-antitoxin system HipA family toxin [Agrobacterium sp. rho-13.3]MDX8310133.1 type II toxin-antitoxin system HipA family toxin [Agrobacterium sp. rho-13.3]
MISRKEKPATEAYVWIWLPGQTAPIVAGRLFANDAEYRFVYGRSYLNNDKAIPIYLPELPLNSNEQRPLNSLVMSSSIRDASPDAWGRRVILNRTFGLKGDKLDGQDLDELTFLLQSGSDRIGALDFQASAATYRARNAKAAPLEHLIAAAERVEKNLPLSPELDQALHHGSSIGGARPKALIEDGEQKFIAKFSSSGDTFNIVKGEYVAMRLAALCGINVAPVKMVRSSGKDVLLVSRFDRTALDGGWLRHSMVSALTILELDEMQARYASYEDLAEKIRLRFSNVTNTLRELFSRLVFNILVGNIDDHARNHAAFWDGSELALTPAYDICPQGRTGQEASQAMLISGQWRSSQIAVCLDAAHHFHLDKSTAIEIVGHQLRRIGSEWRSVCSEVDMGEIERAYFWGRQFLNPYAFYGLGGEAATLTDVANALRDNNG